MRIAKALGVTLDSLAGMYEDDDQGDGEPAGVALVGAESPRRQCVLRVEHAGEYTIEGRLMVP